MHVVVVVTIVMAISISCLCCILHIVGVHTNYMQCSKSGSSTPGRFQGPNDPEHSSADRVSLGRLGNSLMDV